MKEYKSLREEFVARLNASNPSMTEMFQTIQQHTIQAVDFTAVWASGFMVRGIGMIDSSFEIEEFLRMSDNVQYQQDLSHLVAFSRASYHYINLMSAFHDSLDNIGFLYGVKVLGKDASGFATSFHFLFDKDTGNLKRESNDDRLNSILLELYTKAKQHTDFDNTSKHKFTAGLIKLHQPREFIESLPYGLTGNIRTFLDYGSVPVDQAVNEVVAIREEFLPLILELVVLLLKYPNGELK